jgi:DNA-binding transcriptional ArsR family regulator
MPVWEDAEADSGSRLVPAMSLAVELDWLLSAANRPDWRAEHPSLVAVYAARPDLEAEVRRLWGPEQAISCGGFGEIEVLADYAGQLTATDPTDVLGAVEEAAGHVPTGEASWPLASESEEDRRAIVGRLGLLKRSRARRRRYLEVVGAAWEVARPDWEANGRPAVERALARLHRALSRGEGWQEVARCGCHTDKLTPLLATKGPGAETVVVPAYFTHKGLFFDLPGRVLIGVGTEHSGLSARARTEALSRQLRTLSDPTRLAIVDALRQRPRTVGELAEAFALAQPTVSNHVKTLRQAGLVADVPDGRRRTLRLQTDALAELLGQLHHTLGAPHESTPQG